MMTVEEYLAASCARVGRRHSADREIALPLAEIYDAVEFAPEPDENE